MRRLVPLGFLGTAAVLMLLQTTAGCDTWFWRCSGAENLLFEHREALACAGWDDFVLDHAGRIEYREVIALEGSEQHATGRAFCRSCRVEIALLEPAGSVGAGVRRRSPVEIASVIVHEAAHLLDECANGEEPAEQAEAAFLRDYYERVTAGACP